MNNDSLKDEVIHIAEFVFYLLGCKDEVVVHDVTEGRIIWIENGYITNRNVGHSDEVSAIQVLYNSCKESVPPRMLVGYHSKSTKARFMRSSNLFFEDEHKELRYVICVNQDVTKFMEMRNYCDIFLDNSPGGAVVVGNTPPNLKADANNIESITMDVILTEIEKERPFSLDSKEAKMTILRRLNEKGVFDVKHATARVGELLAIPTPTLYKYIKEIKNGDCVES